MACGFKKSMQFTFLPEPKLSGQEFDPELNLTYILPMRYVHLGLAVFLILFAMADIALSGECCNEDAAGPGEEEATCFCCCSHVTIEHFVELSVGIADRPVITSYSLSEAFTFPVSVYHPPRSF